MFCKIISYVYKIQNVKMNEKIRLKATKKNKRQQRSKYHNVQFQTFPHVILSTISDRCSTCPA